MGRPGSIESIDMLSDLLPVIRHRLTSGYLEILSDTTVGIAGHPVSLFRVVVGLVRGVASDEMAYRS